MSFWPTKTFPWKLLCLSTWNFDGSHSRCLLAIHEFLHKSKFLIKEITLQSSLQAISNGLAGASFRDVLKQVWHIQTMQCLNVCLGAAFHRLLKRNVPLHLLPALPVSQEKVSQGFSFSMTLTRCHFFLAPFFFVQGAARCEINPAVFVMRTSVHASPRWKYSVEHQAAEKMLKSHSNVSRRPPSLLLSLLPSTSF